MNKRRLASLADVPSLVSWHTLGCHSMPGIEFHAAVANMQRQVPVSHMGRPTQIAMGGQVKCCNL